MCVYCRSVSKLNKRLGQVATFGQLSPIPKDVEPSHGVERAHPKYTQNVKPPEGLDLDTERKALHDRSPCRQAPTALNGKITEKSSLSDVVIGENSVLEKERLAPSLIRWVEFLEK